MLESPVLKANIYKPLENKPTEQLTATRGDKSNVNADKGAKPSRRYQVAFDGALAPANDIPRRSAAEQELASLFYLNFLLDLLLSFYRRHFKSKFQGTPKGWKIYAQNGWGSGWSNGYFSKTSESTANIGVGLAGNGG